MISAQGLSKRYGGTLAVDSLSFTVRPGTVTGFLGPNGAGKSTTMRLLLGLEHGEGAATFEGRRYAELDNALCTVGTLLDAGAVHPARKAEHHLAMVAAGAGIPGRRVRQVLTQVGLYEVRRQRVGGFSLGMRQRLGLATALLGDPQYLLLDEPANGLDPEGVQWMRRFLQGLAQEGRVVFASSHLLSEMAQLAEDLVVIGQGRLIAAQPVQEFVAAHTTAEVLVRSDQAHHLAAELQAAGARVSSEETDVLAVTGLDADAVGQLAARVGAPVRELHTRRSNLEDAFLAATSHSTQYKGVAA